MLIGAFANTLLFLFISIPLAEGHQSRKEGFERVNKRFGTSWTVELNEDLDYVNDFVNPQVKGEDDNVQSN